MLIVTSSRAVGTLLLDQLLAVSQSPPSGLIHETMGLGLTCKVPLAVLAWKIPWSA